MHTRRERAGNGPHLWFGQGAFNRRGGIGGWRGFWREHGRLRRAALAAHASQPDAAGMLAMPEQGFAAMMGWEHYIEPGRPDGMVVGWPFAG